MPHDASKHWATQVEILAAATLYRLPIYFCTTSVAKGSFNWSVIKPLLAEKIRFGVANLPGQVAIKRVLMLQEVNLVVRNIELWFWVTFY